MSNENCTEPILLAVTSGLRSSQPRLVSAGMLGWRAQFKMAGARRSNAAITKLSGEELLVRHEKVAGSIPVGSAIFVINDLRKLSHRRFWPKGRLR
jgi:hypothetical protein